MVDDAEDLHLSVSVQQIDVALVMKVLEPMWNEKPETASRVRGRIESVLDWAPAREYRQGENPARWGGHLENLLPKKSQARQVVHVSAMPYAELPSWRNSGSRMAYRPGPWNF
jgi:hypothetical protein